MFIYPGGEELREIIKEGLMMEWQRGWEKKEGVDTISLNNLKLKKMYLHFSVL